MRCDKTNTNIAPFIRGDRPSLVAPMSEPVLLSCSALHAWLKMLGSGIHVLGGAAAPALQPGRLVAICGLYAVPARFCFMRPDSCTKCLPKASRIYLPPHFNFARPCSEINLPMKTPPTL